MTPRTAIAQIANMIGRELDTGAGPSEEALAAGPILADAGATTEIIASLLAETHRKRPEDRMIAGYTFILEGALGALRLQASGGDVEADRAIAKVRHRLDDAGQKGDIALEVLMLMARAFARAELDPGRTLQQAMMTAMEAQPPSMPAALTPAEISDHFTNVGTASNHYVRGYTTRNGTHVIPHHQTNTNSTKFDNWSTRGNINPYTGKAGTKESVLN
jgi:hypothetical protein